MEKYQEIERSIIKTYRAKLWSKFVKAIKEYELLKEGDKVCVCISGGKDSMLMAKLFEELLRHSDFPFSCEYVVMNPGYNDYNFEIIKKNLETLNIKAKIVNTNIFEVANMQTDKPCYLCAKMRRGALYRIAKELGCNKIALGHHYDDVIETILMNMLNTGSYQTMLPKLKSENTEGMELIRPMYLIRERDIKAWANYNGLEFILCACKLTEAIHNQEEIVSQRKATKELIQKLRKEYNPNVEKNIFASASNINFNMIIGYKKDGIYHSYLDDYNKEDKDEK